MNAEKISPFALTSIIHDVDDAHRRIASESFIRAFQQEDSTLGKQGFHDDLERLRELLGIWDRHKLELIQSAQKHGIGSLYIPRGLQPLVHAQADVGKTDRSDS